MAKKSETKPGVTPSEPSLDSIGDQPAPESPKFILRSNDAILRDAAGVPKQLDEQTGSELAAMLSTVRPHDNWRIEPVK